MAHAFLLQDWLTLKTAGGVAVKQGVDDYADLAAYQDVVVFLEVADATTTQFEYQTSPTKDDNLFFNTLAAPVVAGVGVTPSPIRFANATVPLSRYLRWRASPTTGAGMQVTFRIWASPNPS